LLGGAGLLGKEILSALSHNLPGMRMLLPTRKELDIADIPALRNFLTEFHPDVIINSAAWTDLDLAEDHAQAVFRVNAESVGEIAGFALSHEKKFVQVSTASVFSGGPREYFDVFDTPAPINVYNASKFEAEQRCKEAISFGGDISIFRTYWLFGSGGNNFVDFIASRALNNQPMTVVSDQWGQPSLAGDVAAAIVSSLTSKDAGKTYHAVNSGVVSRVELAHTIVDYFGADRDLISSVVAEAFGARAERPRACNLSTHEIFGSSFRPWQDALEEYLQLKWPREDALRG
jgi:dTDP-4-dehydrorhamnose reductase